MSPSWMMVCLHALQCLAFLKVFTRNVWEWRASNSSGCRKTTTKDKRGGMLVSKCCDQLGFHWVQVVWLILPLFKCRCFTKKKKTGSADLNSWSALCLIKSVSFWLLFSFTAFVFYFSLFPAALLVFLCNFFANSCIYVKCLWGPLKML